MALYTADELEDRVAPLRAEVERLKAGLDKSVRLQSHYAGLLNMHDGGKRMQFATADAWLDRLMALGEQGMEPRPGWKQALGEQGKG